LHSLDPSCAFDTLSLFTGQGANRPAICKSASKHAPKSLANTGSRPYRRSAHMRKALGLVKFLRYIFAVAVILPSPSWADIELTVNGSEALSAALRRASHSVMADTTEDAAPQDIVGAAKADYSRLLAVLYEYGHFAGTINILVDGSEAAGLSGFAPPNSISNVTITVEPGPVFRLGQAQVAPVADGTELPPEFSSGQLATTPVLRQTAEAAVVGWRDAGHATATVAGQSITADHRQSLINADIQVTPGPLVRFGGLIPSGHDRMRPSRIAEIAGLPTGEVFEPNALTQSEDRLRRTGVFRSIALAETPINDDDTMDIEALMVEAPLRRFGAGGELSSTDGLGLSAYWLHRNLRGGAERLRFGAEISGIGGETGGTDFLFNTNYARPGTFTADTDLVFQFGLEAADEVTFSSNEISLGVGLDHIFNPELEGSVRVSIRVVDITDSAGSRSSTLLELPTSLTFDTRDTLLDAASGYYLSTHVTPFWGIGDGSSLGVRATLDARTYWGFGQDDQTRFALRLQLGTVSGSDLSVIPPDFLFYSGGGGTVRGQSYQSLGARQNGLPSGGRGFVGISAEIRRDINETIGLVGFVDSGYISAGSLGDTSGEWHSGAGLGLRYNTGIGPIRVDLATPIESASSASAVSIYIGIGQSF
jgi:translocation and assembly module TamA